MQVYTVLYGQSLTPTSAPRLGNSAACGGPVSRVPAAIGDLVITCGQGRADGAAPLCCQARHRGLRHKETEERGTFTHNNVDFARIHGGSKNYVIH